MQGVPMGRRMLWMLSVILLQAFLLWGCGSDGTTLVSDGIRYGEGLFGEGLLLEGYGRSVTFPIEDVVLRREGTIEIWIMPHFNPDQSPDRGTIFGINYGALSFSGDNPCTMLYFSEHGSLVFIPDGNLENALHAPPFSQAEEWHHLAVTWGQRGTELFVDGYKADDQPQVKYLAFKDNTLAIGTPIPLKVNFCSFSADELRISTVQRNPSEILESSTGLAPLTEDDHTSLLAHFNGTPQLPIRVAPGHGFNLVPPDTSATISVEIPIPFHAPFLGEAFLDIRAFTMNGHEVFTTRTPLYGLTRDVNGYENARSITLPPIQNESCLRLQFDLEIPGVPPSPPGKAVGSGSLWVEADLPHTDPSSFFGVSGCYNDTFDGELFKRLAEIGVSWLRLPFEWYEIEPENDLFNFEKYDALVAEALGQGITLIPTFQWQHAIPEWVNVGPVEVEIDGQAFNYPPEDLSEWQEYVFTVVDRYKNSISHWIPWNEPNLSRYWYPVDPAGYTDLLEATEQAVHQADPDAYLVGLNCALFDSSFYENCFLLGALNHCDAVGLHPYSIPEDTDVAGSLIIPGSQPMLFREQIEGLSSLIQAYGGSQKIWIDEVGQNTEDDHIPGLYVSEDFQARILVKMFVESLATGAVEKLLWFAPYGHLSFDMMDLDLDPRPACAAFRVCSDFLARKSFVEELHYGPHIKAFLFQDGDDTVIAAWSIEQDHKAGLSQFFPTLGIEPGRKGGPTHDTLPLELVDKYGLPIALYDELDHAILALTPEPCYIVPAQKYLLQY